MSGYDTSIQNDSTRQIRDAETGKIPFRNSMYAMLCSLRVARSLLIVCSFTNYKVQHCS